MKMPQIPNPETLTEGQKVALSKALTKRIIASVFADGVHDLTLEYPDDGMTIVSGKFTGAIKNANSSRPEFQYRVFEQNGLNLIEYSALSGVEGSESDAEPADMSEAEMIHYLNSLERQFDAELNAELDHIFN
jgi:hypothetical protein